MERKREKEEERGRDLGDVFQLTSFWVHDLFVNSRFTSFVTFLFKNTTKLQNQNLTKPRWLESRQSTGSSTVARVCYTGQRYLREVDLDLLPTWVWPRICHTRSLTHRHIRTHQKTLVSGNMFWGMNNHSMGNVKSTRTGWKSHQRHQCFVASLLDSTTFWKYLPTGQVRTARKSNRFMWFTS